MRVVYITPRQYKEEVQARIDKEKRYLELIEHDTVNYIKCKDIIAELANELRCLA